MSIWGERDTIATTRGVLPSRGAVATCLALTSLPLKVPGSIPPTRTLPARFPSGVRDLGTWGRGRGRSKKGVVPPLLIPLIPPHSYVCVSMYVLLCIYVLRVLLCIYVLLSIYVLLCMYVCMYVCIYYVLLCFFGRMRSNMCDGKHTI